MGPEGPGQVVLQHQEVVPVIETEFDGGFFREGSAADVRSEEPSNRHCRKTGNIKIPSAAASRFSQTAPSKSFRPMPMRNGLRNFLKNKVFIHRS